MTSAEIIESGRFRKEDILMRNVKRKFLITVLSLGMVIASQSAVYAAENMFQTDAQEIEEVQEFVTENVARIVGSPRGMLISSVELQLTDLGGGTLRLYGDVLCHEAMEEIKLNLYLDKWITADDDWSQIENFNFSWLAEDYPDEELTMAVVTAEVPNLERGIDYRLRGIAGAWDLDSDLYEVFRADTASIYVE